MFQKYGKVFISILYINEKLSVTTYLTITTAILSILEYELNLTLAWMFLAG